MKGAPLVPTLMLSCATFLFPFVIYYQTIVLGGGKSLLAPLVPKGGALHMVFWLYIAYALCPSSTQKE